MLQQQQQQQQQYAYPSNMSAMSSNSGIIGSMGHHHSSSTLSNPPIGRKGYYLYFQPTIHISSGSSSSSSSISSSSTPFSPQQQHQQHQQASLSSFEQQQQQRFQRSSSLVSQSKYSRYEKERLKLGNKKVIAVGFVGYHEQSMDIVNEVLGKKIFSEQHRNQVQREFAEFSSQFSTFGTSSSSTSSSFSTSSFWSSPYAFPIDSYHDSDSSTIYMYLDAHLDVNSVISQVKKQRMNRKRDDPKCHISMEFVHPDKRFDMKNLRMFRILQLAKQHANSALLSHLGSSIFTNDLKFSPLYSPGRVLPVVAFLFFQKRTEWNAIKNQVSDMDNRGILDQMQKALESQVRAILKKGRFAGTDNTRNPLLMVDPSKCAFVVVEPESQYGSKEFMTDFTSMMFSFSTIEEQHTVSSHPQKVFYARAMNSSTKKPTYPQIMQDTMYNMEDVRDFLKKQYDFFKKQMHSGKRYVLPSSFNWYHATFAFEEFMCMKASGIKREEILRIDMELEKVKPFINPDWQFSENRCSQALNLVKEQFGTDECVMRMMTLSEYIDQAIHTFDIYASGPYQEKFKQQLISELTAFHTQKRSQVLDIPDVSANLGSQDILMIYRFIFSEEQTVSSITSNSTQQKGFKPSKQAVPSRFSKIVANSQNIDTHPSPVRTMYITSLGACAEVYNNESGVKLESTGAPVFLSHFDFTSPYFGVSMPPVGPNGVSVDKLMNSLYSAKHQRQQQMESIRSDTNASKTPRMARILNSDYDYTRSKRYKVLVGFEYRTAQGVSFVVQVDTLVSYLTKQNLKGKQSKSKERSELSYQQVELKIKEEVYSLKNIPIEVPTRLGDSTHKSTPPRQATVSFARLKRIILGVPDSNSSVTLSPKFIKEVEQQSTTPDSRSGSITNNTIKSTTVTSVYNLGSIQQIVLPRGKLICLNFEYVDTYSGVMLSTNTASATSSDKDLTSNKTSQLIDLHLSVV